MKNPNIIGDLPHEIAGTQSSESDHAFLLRPLVSVGTLKRIVRARPARNSAAINARLPLEKLGVALRGP